jgi:hypothetical protein
MSCIIDITEYREKALIELRENQNDINKKILLIKEHNKITIDFLNGCRRALDNWKIRKR